MKKYISIIITILIICILAFIGIYLYLGREIYQQSLNSFLISSGLKEKEVNKFDINKVDTNNFKSYSTDFYTFYYPENYLINILPNSIAFIKDLNQIAELKIINLNADKFDNFEEVSGNYFFTRDSELKEVQNLPEFYNSFFNTKDLNIKKDETVFLISHDLYNESNELRFKKYKVNSYEFFDNFKFLGFTDTEDGLNNIVMYSDNNLLIIGYLTMPDREELIFFINLVTLVNKGLTQEASK